MPLDLIFITPGDYSIEDNGIPDDNISVIRDGTGTVIFTFAHPADSLSFTTSSPGVNLAVNLTETLGAANLRIGDLTNAATSPDSIATAGLRTTGIVTLVASNAITEFGSDAGADIIAGQFIASANSGVGTASNAIETQTSLMEAETLTGGINISNFGTVQIGGASDDVEGLDVATSGNINLSATGSILLADETGSESVHGGSNSGNVALTAIGMDSDILSTVNRDAISAAGGNIVLSAGRDIGFGIIGTNFDNDVRASGSITINAGRDFLVDGFSDIVSDDFGAGTGGTLVVNAGRNIHIRNVAGTDGSLAAGGSAGADLILTTGTGGAVVLDAPSTGAVSSSSGDVIVNSDRILVASASGITANSGEVFLNPATAGREINLGSASDAAFAVEFSDAEFDRVFAPTLHIGNDLAGQITVSSAISPASAANLVLRTGGDIVVQAAITTTGSLELRAGDSLFMTGSPTIAVGGALSIFVDTLGNDGGAGGVVYLGSALVSATSIAINGAGENDTLGGFEGVDQTVHGNDGNDTIKSSGEGHYFGDAGNDLMLAGLSSGIVPEVLDGGGGIDTLDTQAFSGNYTVNLATGVTNFAYESFVNFENVITSNGNDQITGTAGINVIETGAGNDIIDGGAGTDVMRGGAGDDTYYVDNAGDVVNESAGSGVDNVRSALSINLSDAVHYLGAIEAAVLLGAANVNLTGNNLGNVLIGSAGNNIVNGGAGADNMRGMGGNDVYVVDNAGDVVNESVAGSGGIDQVQSALAINLSDPVRIRGDVEQAVLTGSGNVNLTGNVLGNVLIGNAGNNIVNGGAGIDNMRGLGGNDVYVVDNAGDVVNEIAAGSGGIDQVQSALAINLSDALHFQGDIEQAVLTGAGNVNAIGNKLGNVLVGNGGSNVLAGLTGNDLLTGGGGNDYFLFNTALNAATNVDTITDFSVPADTIWLENAIFTGLGANGVLAATAFVVGAAAGDGDDRIIYNNANGWLSYDADGSGTASTAIHFATLAAGLNGSISNADFVVV
jgi:Ca2+-binding RTX toxin-like protein